MYVTLRATDVRVARLCAWGDGLTVARCHGEWLEEWGRGF